MRRLTILGVSLLVLASTSSALAQVATTGTIQIILEDAQGGRLPGVTVTASAPDVVTTRTAVSNAEGVATLEALAPSEHYTIKATLTGFRELTKEDVLARSGQTTTLHLPMALSTVSEQITVTATPAQVVDTTRAIAGVDITLQLTESLPTGRSYQSYLQLVPGVLPDSPVSGGNPSSRSGINWKDNSAASDNIGGSTDNRYYFEGINVTDPVTGTFGANLNTEIIQEQKVITGGIPAEYVGAAGLISTVITKSGSNRYTGSANYFFQNDKLVAKDENLPGKTFSSRDNAFTIGGPLRRDSLWAFGSFRYTNRNEDVSSQDTRLLLREVETTQKQGFAKVTWGPTSQDLLSFIFLNDPYKRSGSVDASVPNNRDVARIQGGNNYSLTYSRVWSRLLIDGAFNSHDGEITDQAVNRLKPRNTIAYQRTDVRTLADELRGGHGQDLPEFRPTTQARGSAQYQWGDHRFKGGFEWAQHEDNRDLLFLPETDRAQYTSIINTYPGTTAQSIGANTTLWTTRNFNVTNASDFNGFISTVNGLPNRSAFYSLYDADGNGTITAAELGTALTFGSTAGNSEGQINYYRILESRLGSQNQKVRGTSFFGQDEIQLNRWTFNAGLRAERWTHYATTGESLFTFDWTWAPRLSAVFDVIGDGSQKLAGFYGRYHDPIRMDMTNFAGSLSGYTREEQVFANNQWVTYRTRGFPAFDAFFAPATKTPYTDEFQLQYEADLGNNMAASATYYHRRSREVFEDFDPTIYTIPEAYVGVDGHGDVNAPNSLFLGWDYFGLDPNNPPVANFFLGTMTGGERNYNGLEFVVRKRFSDRWQGLASYNYLDAKGNTVSDGNADFAGDVFWLDPRAPNTYGTVPGTIHHIFKMGGSYETRWGLELGGGYSWNSGTIVNRTQFQSNRRLAVQVATPFQYGGLLEQWLDPTAIGGVQNPSNGSANLRIRYVRPFGKVTGEFFVDIFNIFNQQTAIRTEDLQAGRGTAVFGDEIAWLQPRRSFLGVRFRF